MIPKNFEVAFTQVKSLADRFGKNESAYLSPKYQEAEVRQDFLDNLFVALGWDVYHREHPNPYEREVKIEKSVMVGDRGKRADYAFYTAPNFLQARFMAEAKKPARQLENPYDCFQAMRYGWNSNTPIAVLTDFEQFLVLDSRYKPSVEKAANGILKKFHYTQYADEESFRELYYLFSRESVGDGSLEKYVQSLKKTKAAKTARVTPGAQIQPVGDTFLSELDVHRDALARGFKNKNPELDGDELTEITQRTLDRLVFIRFLEDKLVEPSEIIDRLGVKSGSAWRDFANEIPRFNGIYNGIIFKPNAILDAPDFQPDEKAFSDMLKWLSHKDSPYDFNTIPIHILGSIYERFLGKTIVVTDKRAKVEEKPEVRKAGGVYYTPEYIVRYIVENTIGKLIEGKTPDEIAKMRFADIACGSGSFLLGIFDYLIKYHVDWYSTGAQASLLATPQSGVQSPVAEVLDEISDADASSASDGRMASKMLALQSKRRRDVIKQGLCRETSDGTLQLSIPHKREILLNNIYGVDLDAQAVEVAQLSLYLKLLEEETTATAQQYLAGFKEQLLPKLDKNIVHGNSLIDYDIMDGPLFKSSPPYEGGVDAALGGRGGALRKLNPMSFQSTFPEVFANGGFDAIVGNPPYVRIQGFPKEQIQYFANRYEASTGNFDIYVNFIERALSLINEGGLLGQIVPNKFFKTDYGEGLRKHITGRKATEMIVDFGAEQVFDATIYTCLLFLSPQPKDDFVYATSMADQESLMGLEFERHSADRFNGDAWLLIDDASRSVLDKMNKHASRLLDLPADMSRGSSSGNDNIFMLDAGDSSVENEITRIPIFATDFNRYLFAPKGQWKIIFPYEIGDNGYKILNQTDLAAQFPEAYSYLLRNKPELLKRKQFNEWYGYSAPRNLNLHEKASIFIPLLANRGLFSLVPNDLNGKLCPMASGGFTIALGASCNLSPSYVLGLLNSTLLFWMLQNMSNVFRGGWITCTKQYFGELPIRTIDFNNPAEKAMHDRMVELVEKMLDSKKKLAAARTDSDRAFYERLCTDLDNKIDTLVYQLYDITSDEKRIVEHL